MMDIEDSTDRIYQGVGCVLPHTMAKIVDPQGQIVPRGSRGELCTSGFPVMKGYLNNVKATNEAIKTDEQGIAWMHSGDECVMNEQGYLSVTGRLKDIIIRGTCPTL